MPSRYSRGNATIPVLLQKRDERILATIRRHRFARADHVRSLHFPNASLRAARERLRKLWLARLLDREFLQLVVSPDGATRDAYAGSAVYCLARRGAALVAGRLGKTLKDVPHTIARNRIGFATLRHHLVATDFFVALEVAFQNSRDAGGCIVEREGELRAALGAVKPSRQAVIPDGAFTLSAPGRETLKTTFHFEIMRADPRGGLDALIRKMRRYVELNREGFFRETWRHDHVRAVIILTPTDARAENLRQLAARKLVHGRNFFWFGSYERLDELGRKRTSLAPETILAPRFFAVDGSRQSLLSALHS